MTQSHVERGTRESVFSSLKKRALWISAYLLYSHNRAGWITLALGEEACFCWWVSLPTDSHTRRRWGASFMRAVSPAWAYTRVHAPLCTCDVWACRRWWIPTAGEQCWSRSSAWGPLIAQDSDPPPFDTHARVHMWTLSHRLYHAVHSLVTMVRSFAWVEGLMVSWPTSGESCLNAWKNKLFNGEIHHCCADNTKVTSMLYAHLPLREVLSLLHM